MNSRLQLHCHTAASRFALIKEGEDWRKEFDSLEDAMNFAATILSDSIPVMVVLDETLALFYWRAPFGPSARQRDSPPEEVRPTGIIGDEASAIVGGCDHGSRH